MSQSVALEQQTVVALTTAVKQILPLNAEQTRAAYPRQIFFPVAPAVDVTFVTAPYATDGGAVPAGSVTIAAASLALGTWDLPSGYRFLGLAGSGSGNATIVLR